MSKVQREIYLDHAAATYLLPEVSKTLKPYLEKLYANPSSLHSQGLKVKTDIEKARDKIGKIINADPQEIIFTGSGTESINLALKGIAEAKKEGHIITSKIEHPAVLDTCRHLEKKGFEITYLPVDLHGLVSPEDLENAIRNDTILISIMYANNEIGSIEPIAELARIARRFNVPFHTDACQAAGALDIDVKRLGVDLMTLNGSKIYGTKGIGVLYKRNGIKLHPNILGGGQEKGLRSGTENVPSIIGLAKALEIAQKEKNKESKRLIELRDYLIKNIIREIPRSALNGPPEKRLPNNANISFEGVEGESILSLLSDEGIFVSTGSACSSKNEEESHVLKAIGLSEKYIKGNVRLTLGRRTTKKDIDYVLKVLPKIIEKLRKISKVD